MRLFVFIINVLIASFVWAGESDVQQAPSSTWSSSIIENDGERFFRALIMSQNDQSIFAIDLAANDCKTHLFKSFLLKEPETAFGYPTGTFFNFTRDDGKTENTFFSTSNVVGKEGETLAISNHKLYGNSNDLNAFFSVMEQSKRMNLYFTTPYGNSYNYKFKLKHATNTLINNIQKCQQMRQKEK